MCIIESIYNYMNEYGVPSLDEYYDVPYYRNKKHFFNEYRNTKEDMFRAMLDMYVDIYK